VKILLTAQAAAITLCLAAFPAAARERFAAPPLQLHAFNPSESLSSPTSTPFANHQPHQLAGDQR